MHAAARRRAGATDSGRTKGGVGSDLRRLSILDGMPTSFFVEVEVRRIEVVPESSWEGDRHVTKGAKAIWLPLLTGIVRVAEAPLAGRLRIARRRRVA